MLKFCLTKLRYYCCNTQVLLLPKMRQCKLFGWIFYFCIALVLFQGVLVEVALSAFLNITACNGRETRIEYCARTTAACSRSTVDRSSIGVICGNLVDEGQGDVVSYTCMGHYIVCIPGHFSLQLFVRKPFCTVDSIEKNTWQIWRDSPTL